MWAQIQMPHLIRKRGPVHPSPFQRDVGSAGSLDGGNGGERGIEEGDTRRETQVVGGPSGASRQRTTTFVVVHFLPSFLPSIQLTNSPSNSSVANHVRTRRSQRRLRSDDATWETPPQRPGEGTAAGSRDSNDDNTSPTKWFGTTRQRRNRRPRFQDEIDIDIDDNNSGDSTCGE